ncbi:MAG: hypothetical protein BWX88_01694 [Planctomycetes bacterium ADurb.Bin126]|nr:MAG: hypothetical protein BWX88_01694 [Planctomycetes bacterium ADurb.Bin126]HOD83377.1 hypothetical protein [Phycisphaerae bacterium]HQL73187.1 hypothetical protein [Phycisphaerae bacterium]
MSGRTCVAVLGLLALGWSGSILAQSGGAKAGDGPSKLELSGARHRLEGLEQKVKLARGQPIKLGPIETEGLKRIWSLRERYPDHAEVQELFERAQKAVMASKGELTDLPKDATAYRQNERKLQALFEKEAQAEWAAFQEQAKASGRLLERAFPPPSHREASVDEMAGKLVVLNNFFYPANQFIDGGREFVAVGGALRGYYFVEISNRSWLGAYEAVKRYRRFINRDMPETLPWTVVGRVTGIDLLVPQAGEEKTRPAAWGWIVEPVAIFVPERTFALADAKLELGGQFAGEAKMEEIKSAMYTVRSVPAQATPEQVTETFVTAIKEKNYPLFLECIEPAYRQTPIARSLCLYHWDWHQHRFATMYCHVKVGQAKVRVVKGVDDAEDNIEMKFLKPEQVAELKKRSGQTVREAELTTQAFDEHGKQYGSLKPRYFRKTDDGRWYIMNYAQPF